MALKPNTPGILVAVYNGLVEALGREPTRGDVEAILQAVVGLIPVEPWMDVDNSGTVDTADAIIVAQVVDAIVGSAPATMFLIVGGVVLLALVLMRRR